MSAACSIQAIMEMQGYPSVLDRVHAASELLCNSCSSNNMLIPCCSTEMSDSVVLNDDKDFIDVLHSIKMSQDVNIKPYPYPNPNPTLTLPLLTPYSKRIIGRNPKC